MNDQKSPWTLLSRSRKYENDWIAVDEHQVRHARGFSSAYGVVHNKQLGTQTIAIDQEGRVCLVGQFRYPQGLYSWELPAGGGGPDQPPLETAQRELREETGLIASKWLPLLQLTVAGSISDSRVFCFVAWELEATERELDPQEVIQRQRVPFKEAVDSALNGTIQDSASVAALLALRRKLDAGDLPADLAAALR
jgi:8-oxo-dGTP pyrophosphatase MutT (NUDIX family)